MWQWHAQTDSITFWANHWRYFIEKIAVKSCTILNEQCDFGDRRWCQNMTLITFLVYWLLFCRKSVTNISNLSPTQALSNIGHNHRCYSPSGNRKSVKSSPLSKKLRLGAWLSPAVSDYVTVIFFFAFESVIWTSLFNKVGFESKLCTLSKIRIQPYNPISVNKIPVLWRAWR